jgi:peptide/nickel transport system substrate-binding protein
MRKHLILTLAAGVALALAACSNDGDAGSGDSGDASAGAGSAATVRTEPDANATVVVGLGADPGGLNPVTNATTDGRALALLAYESLLTLPAGMDAQGMLASDWEVTPTSVEFTLAAGATCSNGRALKASDVQASFEYAANPETGSPYLGVYLPAAGLTIEANDAARTVTFTFEEPFSFSAETLGQMLVVCPEGLADPTALDSATFGTGPYQLTTANAGSDYTYTLREDYGTTTTGILPATVVAKVVPDAATTVSLLASGGLDIARVAGAARDQVDTASLFAIDISAGQSRLFFNLSKNAETADLVVRQAIAQAIDRDAVVAAATDGHALPLTSMASSTTSVCVGYDNSASLPSYGTAAAKETLAGDSWEFGDDGLATKWGDPLTVKLLYQEDAGAAVTAAVTTIQQELAAAGITVELTPAPSYSEVILDGGDWDLVWAPITAELPSVWAGILTAKAPAGGGDWIYNANEAYQTAVTDAQGLTGEEACQAWSSAEQALFDDVDVVPLWEDTATWYSRGVTLAVDSNGQIITVSMQVG